MKHRTCPAGSFLGAVALACAVGAGLAPADPPPAGTVGPAVKGADGVLTHAVQSDCQRGQTAIQVLLPDRIDPARRYSVLYVLPVEAGTEDRYGRGLDEVRKQGLHNRHGLICVLPTFSHLPWYADHPSDPAIRQETYFLKVVLPFVERHYPVRPGPDGRLLLGFSKSGYGAFSLLLRHPDVFGKAAAWDAPLNQQRPDRFGMGPIFGSQENFENYRITKLLEERAGEVKGAKRLALVGYANFGPDHRAAHDLMTRLGIPHEYRDERLARHHWDAGWLPEAVRWLAE